MASNVPLEIGKVNPAPKRQFLKDLGQVTPQPLFVTREITLEEYLEEIPEDRDLEINWSKYWLYEISTD